MLVFRYVLLAGLAISLLGCASKREVSLSEILRDLEVKELGDSDVQADTSLGSAPDMPAAPMAGVEDSAVFTGGVIGELTIQPDTILRLTVAEDSGLNGSYPVNELGAINLGYVGPVILFDMSEEQAEAKIQGILLGRGEFNSATVDVIITRASYDSCAIRGLVGRAGVVKIGAGDSVSLNNALVRVGGIRSSAQNLRVKIVRGGMKSPIWQSLPGEVYSFISSDGKAQVPNVRLRNNDIAVVYEYVAPRARARARTASRGAWVLVLGEVNGQGFYQFDGKERFTMMNLYFKMGGLPPFANDKAIEVIREDSEGFEERHKVNLREILEEGDPDKDFPLQAGDRIIVKEKTFSLF